jgi:hypothetical protein
VLGGCGSEDGELREQNGPRAEEETIREWKGLRHSVPALPLLLLLLLSLSHAPLTELLAGRVSDIKTE